MSFSCHCIDLFHGHSQGFQSNMLLTPRRNSVGASCIVFLKSLPICCYDNKTVLPGEDVFSVFLLSENNFSALLLQILEESFTKTSKTNKTKPENNPKPQYVLSGLSGSSVKEGRKTQDLKLVVTCWNSFQFPHILRFVWDGLTACTKVTNCSTSLFVTSEINQFSCSIFMNYSYWSVLLCKRWSGNATRVKCLRLLSICKASLHLLARHLTSV